MAFFSFKTKPKAETGAPAAETETRPGLIARMRARLNRGDSWLTYDPDGLGSSASVYAVRDGVVGRIIEGAFQPVLGPAPRV